MASSHRIQVNLRVFLHIAVTAGCADAKDSNGLLKHRLAARIAGTQEGQEDKSAGVQEPSRRRIDFIRISLVLAEQRFPA